MSTPCTRAGAHPTSDRSGARLRTCSRARSSPPARWGRRCVRPAGSSNGPAASRRSDRSTTRRRCCSARPARASRPTASGRGETMTGLATTPAAATETPTWHMLTAEDALQSLEVEPAQGLTSAEAAERLRLHGPNRFAEAKAESRLHAFVRQYRDPMQIVLLCAGVISIYPVKQLGTGIVILLLTLLNAVLGLNQEGKAAAAVAALAKMMIVKARVRRDGDLAQVPAEELVPGDVVAIEADDFVPADCWVLAAATLEVAEAPFAAASLPVSKGTDTSSGPDAPLG